MKYPTIILLSLLLKHQLVYSEEYTMPAYSPLPCVVGGKVVKCMLYPISGSEYATEAEDNEINLNNIPQEDTLDAGEEIIQ